MAEDHHIAHHGSRMQALLRRRDDPLPLLLAVLGVVALLLLGVVLVYWSGGTNSAVTHSLYVPIAVAAYFFGIAGSLPTAVVAGLALGWAMPLDVATGQMQTTANWTYRLAFYLLTGVVFGSMSSLLRQRRVRLEEMVATLEDTHAATLRAFATVLESYDDDTGAHCERVAANARVLGAEVGLQTGELSTLYWAGILHDVGKIAVPQMILQKPAALDAGEYALVKRHPAYGASLLRSISEAYEGVAVGVESHHERWDGQGYPRGLSGEEIPLAGRILAVVDSFEAMTASRPYREALGAEVAVEELREGAGRAYDPNLVAIYERLFHDGKLLLEGREQVGRLGGEEPIGPALMPGRSRSM